MVKLVEVVGECFFGIYSRGKFIKQMSFYRETYSRPEVFAKELALKRKVYGISKIISNTTLVAGSGALIYTRNPFFIIPIVVGEVGRIGGLFYIKYILSLFDRERQIIVDTQRDIKRLDEILERSNDNMEGEEWKYKD